jgi:hypothetical protein
LSRRNFHCRRRCAGARHSGLRHRHPRPRPTSRPLMSPSPTENNGCEPGSTTAPIRSHTTSPPLRCRRRCSALPADRPSHPRNRGPAQLKETAANPGHDCLGSVTDHQREIVAAAQPLPQQSRARPVHTAQLPQIARPQQPDPRRRWPHNRNDRQKLWALVLTTNCALS